MGNEISVVNIVVFLSKEVINVAVRHSALRTVLLVDDALVLVQSWSPLRVKKIRSGAGILRSNKCIAAFAFDDSSDWFVSSFLQPS